MNNRSLNGLTAMGLAIALVAALLTVSATAAEFSYRGYVRQYLMMNLEDHPELSRSGDKIGGKGKLSMARTQLRLEGDLLFDRISFKGIGRVSRESRTSYLRSLERAAGDEFVRTEYEDHDWEEMIRELYAAIDFSDNVALKLGKQQVAWGEADFFRSTDIVNGFDYRWRSVLERENEEIRNPLVMANLTIDFPSVEGSLQLLYRPGWDSADRVVNQRDLFGGRYAAQPFKGSKSIASTPYNFHDRNGDTSDANYGFRWSQSPANWGIDYSLLYYRGLAKDPLVDSSAIEVGTLTGVTPFGVPTPSFGDPSGSPFLLGRAIFPFIDTFGLTFNADIANQRMVLRGEMAYIPNMPYNRGTTYDALIGCLDPFCTLPLGLRLPGLGTEPVIGPGGIPIVASSIIEKKTLNLMIGFDKTVPLTEKILGTQRPGLWTVEVFDRWITNFKRSDDIVELFGYGAAAREHQAIFTTTAFEYRLGDHWRIFGEVALSLIKHKAAEPSDLGPFVGPAPQVNNQTHLLGTFANNSQALLRVTYQF
jgi:hypothetical protein